MRATLRMFLGASLMCSIANGCNSCTPTVCWLAPFARPIKFACCVVTCGNARCSRRAASMHIQHMQKALQQMNLLLHNVVSDITGVTGMKIIKAILAGERDPKVLARHRDERCQNSSATIAKSLVGNYREEHLFALRQAVDLYETYQAKIADCNQAIIKQVEQQPDISDDEPPTPEKPVPARDRIRDGVDVRDLLFKKSGVDLFAIPGWLPTLC